MCDISRIQLCLRERLLKHYIYMFFLHVLLTDVLFQHTFYVFRLENSSDSEASVSCDRPAGTCLGCYES